MKAFAHLSPTVPAIFVTAMAMSLSMLVLPGAVVQGEPTPLLAVLGGATGRIAADLPTPAPQRASEPGRKAATSAQLAVPRSEQPVPQRRQAATRAHRHARSRVVQRAPAAPATPITTSRSLSGAPTATSKAHGHGQARKSTGGVHVSRGHGKALGRSSEHHHGLPRGHAKKAPTAPPSATPPKVNGGGNGHEGGKK
jgi:hypothetical protein